MGVLDCAECLLKFHDTKLEEQTKQLLDAGKAKLPNVP